MGGLFAWMKQARADVPEEVSAQDHGVEDSADPGEEVGEVMPEVRTGLGLFAVYNHFTHLGDECTRVCKVVDTTETGDMVKGVMATGASEVATGASEAAATGVVVAEEDTHQAVDTEKIGKCFK